MEDTENRDDAELRLRLEALREEFADTIQRASDNWGRTYGYGERDPVAGGGLCVRGAHCLTDVITRSIPGALAVTARPRPGHLCALATDLCAAFEVDARYSLGEYEATGRYLFRPELVTIEQVPVSAVTRIWDKPWDEDEWIAAVTAEGGEDDEEEER